LREQLGDPDECHTDPPPLREVAPGQSVACHFSEELSQDRIDAAAKDIALPSSTAK
jgi:hypothetical protein